MLVGMLAADDRIPDPGRFQLLERHLEASGLVWTLLRPSQFMQVYLGEAGAVSAAGELRLPMGTARLAPVDVEDIAKAAAAWT